MLLRRGALALFNIKVTRISARGLCGRQSGRIRQLAAWAEGLGKLKLELELGNQAENHT